MQNKKKKGFVCGGTDIDGSMASGSKKIEKKRTKNTQKWNKDGEHMTINN